MASKYRTLVKGKKQKRRVGRFCSNVRKVRRFSLKCKRAITVSTKGVTQEQIDLLKGLEAEGRIPQITWIESPPNGFDDRMKYALVSLHSDNVESEGCKIRRGYDYAWIKIALEHGSIPERYSGYRFMSTPKFIDYIKSLGFNDIAGSKTLNKFIAKATWQKTESRLSFSGYYINYMECKRRNRIVSRFLEIMNEM